MSTLQASGTLFTHLTMPHPECKRTHRLEDNTVTFESGDLRLGAFMVRLSSGHSLELEGTSLFSR